MTQNKLNEVLRLHHLWLKGDKDGVRADLSGAYLSDANLSYANLSDANLSYANLSGAYLSDAYLSDANLSGANLGGANLSDANLSGANLGGANLSDANLSCAYLWGTTGNSKEVKSIHIFPEYVVTYTKDVLQIGCKRHDINAWFRFTDEEIKEMDGDKALAFWHKSRELIFSIIEQAPGE